MQGIKQSKGEGGPLSSAGIMRFMDVSGGGPKIKPEVVMVACAVFIGIILLLNIL